MTAAGSASAAPTLRAERALLRGGVSLLACADEVGRGALAGPVTVGVVVVTSSTRSAPRGVRDSKLLSAAAREALVPRIHSWAADHSVGHATSHEIDALGIMAALRIAGRRALAALTVAPDHVLLDGNHDYLTPPAQGSLLDDAGDGGVVVPPVTTMIKGDLRCAGVAAASILAKTARDAIMAERARDYPGYGWTDNKGYAAPDHLSALRALGPSPQHRISWSLPAGPGHS